VTFVTNDSIGSNKSGAIDWPREGFEAGVEQGVEIFLWLYARHLIEMCE
jgi:hypothetical protein